MEFQSGAKVVSATGDTVGHVDRVVLDPRTKEITHIVVRKGTLFKTDRVLPVNLVAEANADQVMLQASVTKGELDRLPDFEETEYLLADEQDYVNRPQANTDMPAATAVMAGTTPALIWYPTSPSALAGYGSMSNMPYVPASDYVTQTKRNIPDNTVGLKDGARVNSADGHHVGDVERVFADEGTHRATHLLVSHGLLFKTHTPIPVTWIASVTEDEISLAVSEKLLKGLPEYKE